MLESSREIPHGAAPARPQALVVKWNPFIPLEVLIDKDAEIARLDKGDQQTGIRSSSNPGQTSNGKLCTKAPAMLCQRSEKTGRTGTVR